MFEIQSKHWVLTHHVGEARYKYVCVNVILYCIGDSINIYDVLLLKEQNKLIANSYA